MNKNNATPVGDLREQFLRSVSKYFGWDCNLEVFSSAFYYSFKTKPQKHFIIHYTSRVIRRPRTTVSLDSALWNLEVFSSEKKKPETSKYSYAQ